MSQKWNMNLSERHIRTVLKNSGLLKQKKKRSANGERRCFYKHEKLEAFMELQIDVKHILDKHALPEEVYNFIKRNGIPQYQWTAIDVKTRARFLAWSHNINATFGKIFIELVASWLRSCNVRCHITVQLDNGMEFCAGSKRKEKEWNQYFESKHNLSIRTIPAGAKYRQGYVERSHRFDDEYFYVPQGMKTRKIEKFLKNGFAWQTFYNISRNHHGLHMNGLTPSQKLTSLNTLINPNIVFFPPFRLENLLNYCGTRGVEVATNYQIILKKLIDLCYLFRYYLSGKKPPA